MRLCTIKRSSWEEPHLMLAVLQGWLAAQNVSGCAEAVTLQVQSMVTICLGIFRLLDNHFLPTSVSDPNIPLTNM